MKLTLSQCKKKNSGILNGSLQYIMSGSTKSCWFRLLLVFRSVVVRSFCWQKYKQTKVLDVMQSSRKQNQNMKHWDVPEVTTCHLSPIFHCVVNFIDLNLSHVCKSLKKLMHFFITGGITLGRWFWEQLWCRKDFLEDTFSCKESSRCGCVKVC